MQRKKNLNPVNCIWNHNQTIKSPKVFGSVFDLPVLFWGCSGPYKKSFVFQKILPHCQSKEPKIQKRNFKGTCKMKVLIQSNRIMHCQKTLIIFANCIWNHRTQQILYPENRRWRRSSKSRFALIDSISIINVIFKLQFIDKKRALFFEESDEEPFGYESSRSDPSNETLQNICLFDLHFSLALIKPASYGCTKTMKAIVRNRMGLASWTLVTPTGCEFDLKHGFKLPQMIHASWKNFRGIATVA